MLAATGKGRDALEMLERANAAEKRTADYVFLSQHGAHVGAAIGRKQGKV